MSLLVIWSHFLTFVEYVVLGYFIILNGTYLVMSAFAFRALRSYAQRLKAVHVEELLAADAPPITLIAPAYNEEPTCVEAVSSLLALEYPEYEIIVVNDGSKDATLARLQEAFDLQPAHRMRTASLPTALVRGVYRSRRHPALWVVDKENGGKADALNTGIVYCRTPLFCAMDADTLLERQALTRIVRPFLERHDTIAAGGIIRIVNGCTVSAGAVSDIRLPRSWIARFQVLEYLRAFLAGRMGWSAIRATLIISGAFGLFRRSAVVEVGGFATDTVGEDMELIVRLHRRFRERRIPYSITFVPDPVAWTECPESRRILARQRDRWQRGLSEALMRHKVMLFNPRYGRIGMLAYPYFFFLEMLGPVIELGGYLIFFLALISLMLNPLTTIAFLLVAVGLGITLSIAAVTLEELSFRRYTRTRDLLHLFALAVLENLGYRQMTAWWRIRGLVSILRKKQGWGAMERRGFTSPPTTPTPPVAP